jgi:hypothetical protein
MPRAIPTKKHTALVDEIETTEPNVDRTNNLIIGFVIGVMIMVCAGIYVFTSVAEILAQ